MRFLFIILCTLVLSQTATAQKWEFGAWGGTSHYFGDINTDFGIDYIHPAGGLIARENFTSYWSTKYVLSFGTVEASDNLSNYPFQDARNLHFKSNLFEFVYQIEFHFFRYLTGDYNTMFTPYLTGGVGLVHFNPQTELNGNNEELEFYGTEGQGFSKDRYSLTTFTVPYGVGIKYWLGGFWNLGVEVSRRKAFTDYLDDISGVYIEPALLESYNGETSILLADRSTPSAPVGVGQKQRGNSQDNDGYMFVGVSLTYTIRTIKCPTAY